MMLYEKQYQSDDSDSSGVIIVEPAQNVKTIASKPKVVSKSEVKPTKWPRKKLEIYQVDEDFEEEKFTVTDQTEKDSENRVLPNIREVRKREHRQGATGSTPMR